MGKSDALDGNGTRRQLFLRSLGRKRGVERGEEREERDLVVKGPVVWLLDVVLLVEMVDGASVMKRSLSLSLPGGFMWVSVPSLVWA